MLSPEFALVLSSTHSLSTQWVAQFPLDLLLQEQGVSIGLENSHVVYNSNIVFLCVKPHILPGVLEEVGRLFTGDQLIISVVAGVKIETIQNV